tara:strand:+ start:456 stop:704 length:249 start_codon:yes stop_codon:yes gene_type:complete
MSVGKINKATDIVTQLRTNSECLAPSIMLAAADEIERLRKERDEARREVCQFRSTSYPHDMKEVYEIADSRGWDCFEENTDA